MDLLNSKGRGGKEERGKGKEGQGRKGVGRKVEICVIGLRGMDALDIEQEEHSDRCLSVAMVVVAHPDE